MNTAAALYIHITRYIKKTSVDGIRLFSRKRCPSLKIVPGRCVRHIQRVRDNLLPYIYVQVDRDLFEHTKCTHNVQYTPNSVCSVLPAIYTYM